MPRSNLFMTIVSSDNMDYLVINFRFSIVFGSCIQIKNKLKQKMGQRINNEQLQIHLNEICFLWPGDFNFFQVMELN